jgi:antirestriction protein ArdC
MSISKFAKFAEEVTEQIISELEKGNVVWKQPWKNLGLCKNLLSKSSYSGFNQFYLSWSLQKRGFSSPYFLTFQQARTIGAKVKKGAKSFQIVFWKAINTEISTAGEIDLPQNNKTTLFPFVHYVFNIDDIENIDSKYFLITETDTISNSTIQKCENVISDMQNKPNIIFGGNEAFYSPNLDFVQIPHINQFNTSQNYYSTLFHELIHSTGHKTRLNRFSENILPSIFGSVDYSKEELTAEIGATFLNAHCGIKDQVFDTSVAYIQNWLKTLKSDPKLIFSASSKAQKAVQFILEKSEVEIFA